MLPEHEKRRALVALTAEAKRFRGKKAGKLAEVWLLAWERALAAKQEPVPREETMTETPIPQSKIIERLYAEEASCRKYSRLSGPAGAAFAAMSLTLTDVIGTVKRLERRCAALEALLREAGEEGLLIEDEIERNIAEIQRKYGG